MIRLKEFIKSNFIAGLLVFVPIIVTVWLVKTIIIWIDEVFSVQQWTPVAIPGLGLLIAFTIILLAGALGRNVFGGWIVSKFSELVNTLPILGPVYSSVRQAMQALFSGGEKKFGKAVLVEYPREGCWTVGLVTAERPPIHLRPQLDPDMLTIFVPTTPNPTSGFLLFVPRSQVKSLDMKVDEALKLIVSLGLVEGSDIKKHGN